MQSLGAFGQAQHAVGDKPVLVGIAMGHLIRFFSTQNGIIAYKCCQPMNTIIKCESPRFPPTCGVTLLSFCSSLTCLLLL